MIQNHKVTIFLRSVLSIRCPSLSKQRYHHPRAYDLSSNCASSGSVGKPIRQLEHGYYENVSGNRCPCITLANQADGHMITLPNDPAGSGFPARLSIQFAVVNGTGAVPAKAISWSAKP